MGLFCTYEIVSAGRRDDGSRAVDWEDSAPSKD